MELPTKKEIPLDAVRRHIYKSSLLNSTYITMNCLAAVIACYGLMANSTAVVIGAMIVAMLLGPITGFGLSLTDGNYNLMKKSFSAITVGFAGVFLTALIIGFLNQDSAITNEIMSRTSPNLFDLMIGLAGGAAGAISMISPRLSAAFVGVAIATALVPPLSSSALLLVHGEYNLSMGALLLTFTNIVAIQFANSLMLWLNGYRKRFIKGNSVLEFIKSQLITIIVLLGLAIFLTYNLNNVINLHLYEVKVKTSIQKSLVEIRGSYLDDLRIDNASSSDSILIIAIVRAPNKITPLQVGIIEDNLPISPNRKKAKLIVRLVLVDIITRKEMQYFEKGGIPNIKLKIN